MRKQIQELSWLEAMKQRGQLSNDEQKSYQRLQRGFQGELAFDQLCDHFLGNKINCLDDVTIDYQGDVLQMDKIINNRDIIYLVDIKNYQGNYVYKNNSLKTGDVTFTNNIIEQARRSRRIFTRLFDKHHLQLTIKNVIVFINDKSRINLCDDLPEIILNYEEIPTWLMSISHDTQITHRDDWKKLVQKYQVPSFKTSRICTTERFKQLEKGIHCEKCGSFSLKSNRYTLQCACGHIETKQIAFLGTICEYGLIMHHLPLKRSEIVKFFGKNYSTDYIKNTLINYFEPLNVNKKDGKYQNYGQPFDYWFENELISFEKLEKRKNWQSNF
ncbi:hypothetical protein GCM10025886_25010 [Tetragenococcus halophilus subsp. flandriensis]|uniref:nuclease-related domain-containing protein n=1 Tax=Tetragenococcus halophilus TaxID=51669 RepID=UPI0023EA401C|nr:nuclease-related domain-containing protein [Tetragenococcus halophilus]GMA09348.1 hypothetical protein GCM10025886_25010 [Tetragenococcus halophilus subsp. flandriensis]